MNTKVGDFILPCLPHLSRSCLGTARLSKFPRRVIGFTPDGAAVFKADIAGFRDFTQVSHSWIRTTARP